MERSVCLIGLLIASSLARSIADEPLSDVSRVGAIGSPPRVVLLPERPYAYASIELPSHVAKDALRFDNQSADNVLTDHGATLGRVLFYDRSLSANGSTSCASCHSQAHAFAEAKNTSTGFEGGQVRRNSMSLVNLRYYARGRFFWDERSPSLEHQVLMPISDPVEMGHQIGEVVSQLAADPLYPPLFLAAFGDAEIDADRVSKALAQFVRSIVSFGSRYDEGRALVDSVADPFPNFTAQENLGKEQFFGRARCAECHLPDSHHASRQDQQTAFFQLAEPTVNGIDSDDPDKDGGVGEITARPEDDGKFKSSSLRNIEVTGPYMHDGRFHTLDQVIEHYNWSVRPHRNLDERLEDFAANGLAIPEVQKVALEAFLRTLTDQRFLSDPKYSDPFVREGGKHELDGD